jgi:Transposase DDE domain
LAQRLIGRVRRLYGNEDLGFDLDNTVYVRDSTTIDLYLAVFPWPHFRTTQAGPSRKQGEVVKRHTLLDLRGNSPSFIHVSDSKLHDVHALDLLLPEAGAIYVMDRGYYVDVARSRVLHLAGAFFVARAKSNMDAHRVYSAPSDRTPGIICDQTNAQGGHCTSQHFPEHQRRIRWRDAETGKNVVFLTNQFG